MDEKVVAVAERNILSIAKSLVLNNLTTTEKDVMDDYADKIEKIHKKRAESYKKLSEDLKEKDTSSGGQNEYREKGPANVYRIKLMNQGETCGICMDMLERLQDEPIDVQTVGVTGIAELYSAMDSGADTDRLKEIFGQNQVLQELLEDMGREIPGGEDEGE